MQEIVNKLKNCFTNKVFDEYLDKNTLRYYQIKSSIHVLDITDDIIAQYRNEEFSILNVYGLFQYLFIAIDAIYDLAEAITKNKWTININNNPRLRDIKYIRNDCIGHPTYRQYGNNKIGFCYLDIKNTTKKYLVYDCFLDTDKSLSNKKIDIEEIISNFEVEIEATLKDIYGYIIRDKNIRVTLLYPKICKIYNQFQKGIYHQELIDDVKSIYIKSYHLEKNTKNRFIWRLNIIEDIHKIIPMNNKEKEVLNFLTLIQLKKLMGMAITADKELFSYEEKMVEVFVKEPTLLKYTKDYLKTTGFKDVIKDKEHPLFNTAIKKIIDSAPDAVKDLFTLMKREENNQSFIYALGSVIDFEKI